jgi:hypothetical protein
MAQPGEIGGIGAREMEVADLKGGDAQRRDVGRGVQQAQMAWTIGQLGRTLAWMNV